MQKIKIKNFPNFFNQCGNFQVMRVRPKPKFLTNNFLICLKFNEGGKNICKK